MDTPQILRRGPTRSSAGCSGLDTSQQEDREHSSVDVGCFHGPVCGRGALTNNARGKRPIVFKAICLYSYKHPLRSLDQSLEGQMMWTRRISLEGIASFYFSERFDNGQKVASCFWGKMIAVFQGRYAEVRCKKYNFLMCEFWPRTFFLSLLRDKYL